MSLFPERQAAVKVLYEAASQLLSCVAGSEFEGDRRLSRIRVKECLELAEEIEKMGQVKITVDRRAIISLEVENIPFSLGIDVNAIEPDEKVEG